MENPVDSTLRNLTIGSLARVAGVHVETIRFYQRKGLLPEPARSHGQIRRYGAEDVARVRFIKSAQRLGFSLDEIDDLLRLDDGVHCEEARRQGERKLREVRARLADLRQIEKALSDLVARCCATSGAVRCPLIAALHTRGKRR
jgi:MerR family transcriptional regulator, mercuric resistance operon regulatory protein